MRSSITTSRRQLAATFLLAASVLLSALLPTLQAETKEIKTAAFQIQQEVVIAAKPESVYDAATGDISGWWDHHMSEHPKKLYIEAKPGGCFCEIFDDAGNGAQHAVVIYADRGKMLRFTGPLGFSGMAIDSVTTYEFLPDPADWITAQRHDVANTSSAIIADYSIDLVARCRHAGEVGGRSERGR